MRLFIAVLLDDSIKDALMKEIGWLKTQSVQGNFTRRENLHLTLAFLGETDKLSQAKKAMERVKSESMSLCLGKQGMFGGRDGDLFWRGLKPNPTLEKLQKDLCRRLEEQGFSLEQRKFVPHLTLGRRVILSPQADRSDCPCLNGQMKVKKISLMKSERVGGKLVYTEIFSRQLEET